MVADRMTIELVVEAPDRERDLGLRFRRGATGADLLAALSSAIGLGNGAGIYVRRLDRWIEALDELADIPFVRGDRIRVGPPDTRDPRPGGEDPAGLQLVVVGGPAMGAAHPLAPGRIAVGRGRDCDVTIEDAAMSRTHLIVEASSEGVRVSDAGSTNGTFIAGSRLSGTQEWTPGQELEAGASLLRLERAITGPANRARVTEGAIPFNRPPRVHSQPPQASFAVPAAPRDVDNPRLPWIAAGVPLVFAALLWWLLPGSPAFIALLVLSPLVATFTYLEERRRGSRVARRDTAEWQKRLDRVVGEIESARATVSEELRNSAPALTELRRRAATLDRDLWLRRIDDDDFLNVRFGWGDAAWGLELQSPPESSGRLQRTTNERLEPLKTLSSVPLTFSLRDAGVVGLAGDRPAVEDAVNWWLVQTATLHSPADVSVVAVGPADDPEPWSWVRWLPHAAGSAALAREARISSLIDSVTGSPDPGQRDRRPVTVAVLHESAGIAPSTAAKLLRHGPEAGVYVIWAGSDPASLPGDCRAIVEVVSDSGEAGLTVATEGSRRGGALEGVDSDAAREVALALAPVIDAADGSDSSIPSALSVFDVLPAPSLGGLASLWDEPPAGLRAPLGRALHETLAIDLVDEGPHALIGGMTGSGKSELLRTLIVSLAATYPPTRVNFLLVDYKGGAAFKDAVRLPHVVGFVTDLQHGLAQRALAALEAEVRRREQIFAAAGIRDIAEMEVASAPEAPPRLILVVDELATLVKELPAFVEGIVDVAQRGRSLGLHLVLATQRPAGVITDAVRANTNLRIALRVADDADSIDVLGTPAAARIPRALRGRAFVKKGPEDLVEVQVATGSCPVPTGKAVEVWDLAVGARSDEDSADSHSQLDAYVDEIVEAARSHPPQRSPLVPPLPERVPLAELPSQPMEAAIGILDEPHLQRQRPAIFDLRSDGGLLVYGTGGAGKTALLTTIATSLSRATPPDQLHLYGLDMTGGGLARIQGLPHCGGVVDGGDTERVRRLVSMLQREIDRRKKTDGIVTTPRVVTFIDGYSAFTSAFERVDLGEIVDRLPRLISEGRSLGIQFVISAERRSAIPGPIASLIARKIVLRLSDDDEYATFGLNPRDVRGLALPPGRGFVDGTQFQAAITETGDTEAASSPPEVAGTTPGPGGGPARVETLPVVVTHVTLPVAPAPLMGVFGIAETDLAPATADLRHAHFLISGAYRSGRSTALEAIARGLARATPKCELHLLAPRPSPLVDLDLWTTVWSGAGRCEEAAAALAGEADTRAEPTFVFVDDADDLTGAAIDASLADAAKRGRDGSLRIVAAGEVRTLHRSFAGWLLELRKDKRGLLLDPDLEVDGDLFGVRLPRRTGATFPPGRGYLVGRGALDIVQVASSFDPALP